MAQDGDDALVAKRVNSLSAGADGDTPGILPLLDDVEGSVLLGGGNAFADFLFVAFVPVPVSAPGLGHFDDSGWLAGLMSHVWVCLENGQCECRWQWKPDST